MMKAIGLAGWSGAGKTTLLVRLIPILATRGLRVSTLKHAHHHFDVDHPGKDSHEHRLAGAHEVLVSSGKRWALMHELRGEPEPRLRDLIRRMSPVDLLVVEGFKRDTLPKIEVHRIENGKPWLHPDDPFIRGVATDDATLQTSLDRAPLSDPAAVADMALRHARPIDEILAGLDGGA